MRFNTTSNSFAADVNLKYVLNLEAKKQQLPAYRLIYSHAEVIGEELLLSLIPL